MIRIPVLAVQEGKGIVLHLEIEASREGKGDLFLDSRLVLDEPSRRALKKALSHLKVKKADVSVRISGDDDLCLCGGSFSLSIYLGMYACVRDMIWRPGTYATGCINEQSEVTAVGELIEKIRTVLGKAELLIVPSSQGIPVEGLTVKEAGNLQEAVALALIERKITIYGTDT